MAAGFKSVPLAASQKPGASVLVAGATGGVGQRLTTRLLEAGYQVRIVTRNPEKAADLFGRDNPNLEILSHDLGNFEEVQACMEGMDGVFCLVGTTAFPTDRWSRGQTAEQSCDVVPQNLIKATPKTIQRFVMVTSAGVERVKQIPYNILNTFKVLTYKRKAEETLMDSGLPFTIFRPDRLTDGPWTSTDLNTLLKADTKGTKKGVKLSLQDDLGQGQASRITVAEACMQCLAIKDTENRAYAITSTEDEGPETDRKKWEQMFASLA
ncbi:unnamed protein product [Ostreobium quekettii]|uniref:NAD(P)-binding domain-containing protein n=1 Tax=Ostreobium quekettii TaxID=121088 RepID=A0A8S1JDP9_9CHLO|nr:unnamed protein product [Ostreobium quekettii]